MAVIQISRIQHRRGLQENLPQLASAEFGWSIDQRRLFIGNGTVSEGAPYPGNTEILTQYTDIASVISSYVFKGDESGYTSQTGISSANPISRTLQHKLDEQISVRDFGAKGDGYTDDTAAIKRALAQIYPVDFYASPGVRRVLHFPAGVYLVSETLAVPCYAHLLGDGAESSIIQGIASETMLTLADSKGQFGVDFGSNAALPPSRVVIEGMTLQTMTDYDVVLLDSVSDVAFVNVRFVGIETTPISVGSGMASVKVRDTLAPSKSIAFHGCEFRKSFLGIDAQGSVSRLMVIGSTFDTLYNAIRLDGTTAAYIAASSFDKIATSGIISVGGSSTRSISNYFNDVGNVLGGVGSPIDPVIDFEGPNNQSFGDVFERPLQLTVPVIRTVSSLSNMPTIKHSFGTLQTSPGGYELLVDNNSGNVFVFGSNVTAGIIDYSISRGSNVRIGTMKYILNGSSVNFEEDFTEASDIGVSLSFLVDGSDVYMQYSTSALGQNAIIKYQLRNFG